MTFVPRDIRHWQSLSERIFCPVTSLSFVKKWSRQAIDHVLILHLICKFFLISSENVWKLFFLRVEVHEKDLQWYFQLAHHMGMFCSILVLFCQVVIRTFVCSVSMWLNMEPCGLTCGCMTWLLIVYGMYSTTVKKVPTVDITNTYDFVYLCWQFALVLPWLGQSIHAYIHIILFNVASIAAILSHARGISLPYLKVITCIRPARSFLVITSYFYNQSILVVFSPVFRITNQQNFQIRYFSLKLFDDLAMCTDPGAVPRDALPLLDDEQEYDEDLENNNKSNLPIKYGQIICIYLILYRVWYISVEYRCLYSTVVKIIDFLLFVENLIVF